MKCEIRLAFSVAPLCMLHYLRRRLDCCVYRAQNSLEAAVDGRRCPLIAVSRYRQLMRLKARKRECFRSLAMPFSVPDSSSMQSTLSCCGQFPIKCTYVDQIFIASRMWVGGSWSDHRHHHINCRNHFWPRTSKMYRSLRTIVNKQRSSLCNV